MLNFSGLPARIAYAVLYAVVTFIIVYIIGILLGNVAQAVEIGELLKKYAALLGLLVGIVVFLSGRHPSV